jgi:hypothetical protein
MPWVFRKVTPLAWPLLLAISPTFLTAQPAGKVSFSKDVAPLLTHDA